MVKPTKTQEKKMDTDQFAVAAVDSDEAMDKLIIAAEGLKRKKSYIDQLKLVRHMWRLAITAR